ncbi:MAG: efflux RND transporter periplasmic adaptor subunit [Bacteroidota bacterium]
MNKKLRPYFYALIIIAIAIVVFYPKIKLLFPENGDDPGALPSNGSKALNVNVIIVEPERLVEIINSSGTLIPDEEVDLSFETSGKIIQLKFDEGTKIKKGQLLAKINDKPLQAQLQKLQAQKKLSEEREYRQRSLLSRDAISQESYDQAVTELQSIEADIMLIQARIEETELRAPFDGIIGLRHVSEGAYVNQNTQIARLIKINPLKIEFSVPERYSGEIKSGFPIKFNLDGVKDALEATVYAVEPKVDISTRNILVRARYSNPGNQIKPGRFVAIKLELSEVDNAITVPTEALIPEMEGDKLFVYRSGKAESTDVTTGLRTEDVIQIETGLQPGDTVITTGILQLRHNMPVIIDKIK